MSLKFNRLESDFYQFLGLPKSKFIVGEKILDIYNLLGIKPEFDEDGRRKLTPYEILGVPPQFYSDGQERPIVFILKRNNICKKIGRLSSDSDYEFIYKAGKVKDKKDPLADLVAKYKNAILEGREEEATNLLSMIDTLSGGKASELLSSFFNYRKYYKSLQKQLLIDIFAHFFINYVYSKVKEAKGGILNKEKVFKPFKLIVETLSSEAVQNSEPVTPVKTEISSETAGLDNLKSISVKQDTFDIEDMDIDIKQEPTASKSEQNIAQGNLQTQPASLAESAQTTTNPDEQNNLKDNEKVEKKQPDFLDILLNENNDTDEYDKFETDDFEQVDVLEATKFQNEIEQKLSYEDANADLEFENLQMQLGDISEDISLDLKEAGNDLYTEEQNKILELETLASENPPEANYLNVDAMSENIETSVLESEEIENRDSVIKVAKPVSIKKYGLAGKFETQDDFVSKLSDKEKKSEEVELQPEKNLD